MCKNNLDNVFYAKEIPNYLVYVNRIEQVRREQEEKMKMKNVRLPKDDNPKWNNYTRRVFNTTESDCDILFYNTQNMKELSLENVKRSLHYKLHSDSL